MFEKKNSQELKKSRVLWAKNSVNRKKSYEKGAQKIE